MWGGVCFIKKMEHIKKRLVFYFYTFENFMDNRAIKIHLKCLKHYANVFDEALFIISVDNTGESKLIFDTEVELLKLGFNDIHFKIHKNNSYREAQPFYNEIVAKLNTLDGLTFFGHNKGTTNYENGWAVRESIDAWIIGMYYLNLEFINEVETSLLSEPHRFYGAFLTDARNTALKSWLYSGTFYWINCLEVWNDATLGNIHLPSSAHHRGFAENFPGSLYEWNNGVDGLDSHGNMVLNVFDYYTKAQTAIPILLGNNIVGYENLKKNIFE